MQDYSINERTEYKLIDRFLFMWAVAREQTTQGRSEKISPKCNDDSSLGIFSICSVWVFDYLSILMGWDFSEQDAVACCASWSLWGIVLSQTLSFSCVLAQIVNQLTLIPTKNASSALKIEMRPSVHGWRRRALNWLLSAQAKRSIAADKWHCNTKTICWRAVVVEVQQQFTSTLQI